MRHEGRHQQLSLGSCMEAIHLPACLGFESCTSVHCLWFQPVHLFSGSGLPVFRKRGLCFPELKRGPRLRRRLHISAILGCLPQGQRHNQDQHHCELCNADDQCDPHNHSLVRGGSLATRRFMHCHRGLCQDFWRWDVHLHTPEGHACEGDACGLREF